MQELDYCMNLPKNGDSFEQIYQGDKTIQWNIPPVDMCHLISSADVKGIERLDGYNYAISTATEYITNFLVILAGLEIR